MNRLFTFTLVIKDVTDLSVHIVGLNQRKPHLVTAGSAHCVCLTGKTNTSQ